MGTDETLGDIADYLNDDNESGDCLDHLKFDKGDKIVDINSCDLPAYIIRNQEVIGMAEMVKGTENRVKYSCVENYKLRGNRIVECRCRGNRCRTKPKNLPWCAPAVIQTSPSPLTTRSQQVRNPSVYQKPSKKNKNNKKKRLQNRATTRRSSSVFSRPAKRKSPNIW